MKGLQYHSSLLKFCIEELTAYLAKISNACTLMIEIQDRFRGTSAAKDS